MDGIDDLEMLFVVNAFIFQIILIIHFAFRKWHFELAVHYGSLVYCAWNSCSCNKHPHFIGG